MTRQRWMLRFAPALCWMGMIFVLSSQKHVPSAHFISIDAAAVLGHFVLYAVLALLLIFGLVRLRWSRSGTVLVAAVVIAVLYGASDELHQSFVPGRDASYFDLAVDFTGACAAVLFVYVADREMTSRCWR